MTIQESIGVLALQGCVEPHKRHIEVLGYSFVAVKRVEDFAALKGLIIPGGESTTFLRLLGLYQLEAVFENALKTLPVWGICAGAILMAREVSDPVQKSFGAMDIKIRRNAYGRQLQSFQTQIDDYPVSFIRAPRIESVGKSVEVLATFDAEPIWIRSSRSMVTTFHSELTQIYPSPWHQYFIKNLVELPPVSPKNTGPACL